MKIDKNLLKSNPELSYYATDLYYEIPYFVYRPRKWSTALAQNLRVFGNPKKALSDCRLAYRKATALKTQYLLRHHLTMNA